MKLLLCAVLSLTLLSLTAESKKKPGRRRQRGSASSFLSKGNRRKRVKVKSFIPEVDAEPEKIPRSQRKQLKASSGWFEEMSAGDWEQECIEEQCSREENSECFGDKAVAAKKWRTLTQRCYIDRCNPQGTKLCHQFWNRRKCVCKTGWEHAGEQYIQQDCSVDRDECKQRNVCGAGQICINTRGSYKCECQNGYKKTDADTCEMEDLCKTNSCALNEQCVSAPGTFSCDCLPGFYKTESDVCVDINECADESVCEGAGQQCVNSEGSYACECTAGYNTAEDGSCADVDECENSQTCSGTDGADAASYKCVNTVGSFRCEKLGPCADFTCPKDSTCATDAENQPNCVCSQEHHTMVDGACALSQNCDSGMRRDYKSFQCVDIDECTCETVEEDSNGIQWGLLVKKDLKRRLKSKPVRGGRRNRKRVKVEEVDFDGVTDVPATTDAYTMTPMRDTPETTAETEIQAEKVCNPCGEQETCMNIVGSFTCTSASASTSATTTTKITTTQETTLAPTVKWTPAVRKDTATTQDATTQTAPSTSKSDTTTRSQTTTTKPPTSTTSILIIDEELDCSTVPFATTVQGACICEPNTLTVKTRDPDTGAPSLRCISNLAEQLRVANAALESAVEAQNIGLNTPQTFGCPTGFEDDGGECVNIDECYDDTYMSSCDGSCMDYWGSARCYDGYLTEQEFCHHDMGNNTETSVSENGPDCSCYGGIYLCDDGFSCGCEVEENSVLPAPAQPVVKETRMGMLGVNTGKRRPRKTPSPRQYRIDGNFDQVRKARIEAWKKSRRSNKRRTKINLAASGLCKSGQFSMPYENEAGETEERCYKAVAGEANMATCEDAQEACIALGGDLAKIDTRQQWWEATKKFGDGSFSFWIDGYSSEEDAGIYLINDDNLPEECILVNIMEDNMYVPPQWNVVNSKQKHRFLCQFE